MKEMGQASTARGIPARAILGACALAFFLLAFSSTALAVPFHPRTPSRDVTGLNHACGTAVDSKGDLYASSAGESKIKVYNPSHVLLTEISDANTPCGLAVTTTGNLYASEKATGEVVRFKPNAYPFSGTPTYGSREVIDSSTKAKGIAVDPTDSRLYVAAGDHVAVYKSDGSLDAGNEVQTVSVEGATGGTFKLKFDEGPETAPLEYNAEPGKVKAALEALSTIGAGNVEVTKPSQFSVTFTGKLAGTDVPLLIADASGLTGSGSQKVTVSELTKGFSAQFGEGTLTEASGVAAFTYPFSSGLKAEHFLWVADANGLLEDGLYLFRAQNANALELKKKLNGAATPDGSFGFGAAGAYLAEDPGNRDSEGKCVPLGEQACTAGHLFLYDAAHKALDEFDASGSYLDQTRNAAFADAEPTAIAIDRSGVAEKDGTIYVTAGPGAGAKALAFGPLKAPSRKILKEPLDEAGGLSHKEVKKAQSVAVDSHGDAYVATGANGAVRIYGPNGAEITKIEDPGKPRKVAVDSTGTVYVADENGSILEREATYYTPSKFPPDSGTTYTRRAEPIITSEECPSGNRNVKTLAVNPGPGAGKDHLFVLCGSQIIRLYDSAAKGSGLIKADFAQSLRVGIRESIAVNGATGTVYVGENLHVITGIDEATEKLVVRFEDTGFSSGAFGANPYLAVDQSDGHIIEFDGVNKKAREYDGAGSFVAEFGTFTEGIEAVAYGVGVDNACALHEPEPLSGAACEAYDPANGTLYIAFDDTNPSNPPYDVNAFGPLRYPEPSKHKLMVEKKGSGSGKVSSSPAGIDCGSTCSAEYLETEVVALTAKADPENKFEGWEGCEAEEEVSSTEGTCEVTMDEARKVTAEFKTKKTEKVLKVVIDGSGKVTGSGINCPGDCEEKFGEGNEVTLSASAPLGSEFVEWLGGDCEGITVPTCTVTMNQDEEITAEFGVEHPLLTVISEGGGTGTVTSDLPGIECPPTCSHKYDLGDEVVLSAEADPGSVFAGWSEGGCEAETVSPSEGTCEVTMTEPKTVTATFDAFPRVEADPPAPILYDEATLRGKVDPEGLATKYHFKYLTQQEYEDNGETFEGARTTAMEELAAGEGFVAVEASLVGLEEGVEYRFRLGAENAVGLAEDEGTFETLQRRTSSPCANGAYRVGPAAHLPDCRAYELVTPAQTDGLTPQATDFGGSPSQGINDWLTVQRGEGAGERLTYFTEGTLPGFEGNGVLDGYRAERGAGAHPAAGWQSAVFSPNYVESAPSLGEGLKLPHQLGVASDQLYSVWEIVDGVETFPETLPSGTYLRTPTGFEALGQGESGGTDLEAIRDYLSAGGDHVIFSSSEELEEGAAPQGTAAIYDRAAGEASAEVISVKPDGSAFGATEGATYAGAAEDGSAVVFSVQGTLYLHREGETIEIAPSGTFAGISEDGRYVFYALGNGESTGSLFRFDTQTEEASEISEAGIFAAVSPDGSHAFFSEEPEAGEHNLYAWDGAEAHLIGQLSPADFESKAFAGIAGMNLAAWTTSIGPGLQLGRARAPVRSTPDGDVFVFQSHASLTAYDNEGAGEIYRYDSAAEPGQRLLCVSCAPSGAPPSSDALLEDVGATLHSPVQAETMIANVTDSGQEVFFQSFDRLLPEDANETEDAYEWEAQGSGGCTRAGGCLALISSGQGETPSILYAMSPDGHDVFIQTKEKLVGADVAGSPSIYDARVGGGIPEPAEEAPCQGDACQGQGSEPPALPDLNTGGPGESPPTEVPITRKPCAKGKHRVKGRCVAVKHRHRKRHRRAHAKRGGRR
jgi:Divergent InlB B-repeat domain